MKTLILNGSPRPDGDIAALLAALKPKLDGEVVQVDCYGARISPCVDCRCCMAHSGCALKDDMQRVYPVVETCDCVVVATPVYFSLPTPPVMSVCSRLQTYFSQLFFRKCPPRIRPKRGGIVLTGGGCGSAAPAEAALRRMLKAMRCEAIGPVAASLNTDQLPAREDEMALESLRRLADFLKGDAESHS